MGVPSRRWLRRWSWAGTSAGRHGPSAPRFCSKSIRATSNLPWRCRLSSSPKLSSWRSSFVGSSARSERLRTASTPRMDGRSDRHPRRPAWRDDRLADLRANSECNPPEFALARVEVALEGRPLLQWVDLALSPDAGELERLAIARAWAREPDVLFLDEFTNHQDAAHEDLLDSLALGFHGRGGTVVVVSHRLDQVRRMATRGGDAVQIAIVIDGQVYVCAWPALPSFATEPAGPGPFLRRLALASESEVELAAVPTS